jgi:hypothetical protein
MLKDLRTYSIIFIRISAAILVLASILLSTWSLERTKTSTGNFRTSDYFALMEACQTQVMNAVGARPANVQSFKDIWVLCGNQLYNLDYLQDFDIRREKLLRQELDERVVLWMVVTITFSGVALAGLQLLASYKLASAGNAAFAQENDFSIEAGKLSLKSSVTGLIVLTISLIFFIVYLKWVYPIQEVNMEKPSSLNEYHPLSKIAGYGNLGLGSTTPFATTASGGVPPPSSSSQAQGQSTPPPVR